MPEEEGSEEQRSDASDEDRVDERQLGSPNFLTFIAATWRSMRSRFGTVVALFFVGNLLIYAAIEVTARTASPDSTTAGALLIVAQFLLTATIGAFLAASAGLLRVEAQRSERPSALWALRSVGSMWGSILAAGFATGSLAALALLALPGLGLFVGLPLRLGPPVLLFVIAFEKMRLGVAASQTRTIIRGSAFRIYTYLLLVSLMSMVVVLLALRLAAMGLGAAPVSDVAAGLLYTAATVTLFGLLDVALSAGLLVSYLDCRRQADEDFSLDKLAAQAAER